MLDIDQLNQMFLQFIRLELSAQGFNPDKTMIGASNLVDTNPVESDYSLTSSLNLYDNPVLQPQLPQGQLAQGQVQQPLDIGGLLDSGLNGS